MLGELVAAVLERALQAEMTAYLGAPPRGRARPASREYRARVRVPGCPLPGLLESSCRGACQDARCPGCLPGGRAGATLVNRTVARTPAYSCSSNIATA
jgi:hypothetical protein